MSFDANSIAIAAAAADVDHRKKRRNRTTHSCINCHTTKRKCDRKRPCGRCTQLGLTGLCVYEVDDPATADDPNVDETSKLRKRIAELEGVIRELKNKPHPKWAQAQGPGGDLSFHTRSHNAKRRRQSDEDDDDYDALEGAPGSSGIKVEPGFNSPAYTLPDSFRLPSDSFNGDSSRGINCECLTHPAAFQALTELDSYLRSAINVLGGIRHNESSPVSPATPHARCALLAPISRLQDMIAQSTGHSARGMPLLPSLPHIRQPPPASPHSSHGHHGRSPLSVQVPTNFHDSISPTVPASFNLRPPPQPLSAPASYHGHPGSSYAAGCCDNGMITPPLSSTSHMAHPPWDGAGSSSVAGHSASPILPSSHTPRPLIASPALSHASDASRSSSGRYSHGSSNSGGPLPNLTIPVPDCLEREAVDSLVGMYAGQQPNHGPVPFYPPTASSVPFDYDITPPSSMGPPSSFDFPSYAAVRAGVSF